MSMTTEQQIQATVVRIDIVLERISNMLCTILPVIAVILLIALIVWKRQRRCLKR